MSKELGAVTFGITEELVDSLIAGALEGGSNYWIESVDVVGMIPEGATYKSEVVARGGTLRVHVIEDEAEGTTRTYKLTLEKMLKGIGQYCHNSFASPDGLYVDGDASDADSVLQFALFGDLVYG